MSKKDFSNMTPAKILLSETMASDIQKEVKADEMQIEKTAEGEQLHSDQEIVTAKMSKVPKGYKLNSLYIETKTKKLQLLARPSTIKEVQRIAKKNKVSTNEMINRILEDYIYKKKE